MSKSNIIMELDSYKNKEIRNLWENMAKDTSRCCDICGKKNIDGNSLIVEHSHKTGIIRGLVCKSCNYQLGWIERLHGIDPAYQPFYDYLKKAEQEEIELSTFYNDIQELD